MKTYAAYYGTIRAREENRTLLQGLGISLAPYDEKLGSFPARAPQSAVDQLNQFPADFKHALVYRAIEHETAETAAMSIPQLRAEIAFCAYMAAANEHEIIAPATWASRGALAHIRLDKVKAEATQLLRLAETGEVVVSKGLPDQHDAAGFVSVRVFYDRRNDLVTTARAMVIETAIPETELDAFLGGSTASFAGAALEGGKAEISLMGDQVPMQGELAARVIRSDWSPKHAGSEPPLELLSFGSALRLAKNYLPHSNFAADHGMPAEALLNIERHAFRLSHKGPRDTLSLFDLAEVVHALSDAKLLLERSAETGSQWVAMRIGHLLEAQADLQLAPSHQMVTKPTANHATPAAEY